MCVDRCCLSKAWFGPGSNRGPSACKADMITTTPPNPISRQHLAPSTTQHRVINTKKTTTNSHPSRPLTPIHRTYIPPTTKLSTSKYKSITVTNNQTILMKTHKSNCILRVTVDSLRFPSLTDHLTTSVASVMRLSNRTHQPTSVATPVSTTQLTTSSEAVTTFE